MAKHNELGKTGEGIAERYLVNKGFEIIERNYRKPYGELDIVAKRGHKLHFVEVKSVSGGTGQGMHRPEDNVHPQKLRRLARVIQAYIFSHHVAGSWQFDVLCVYVDPIGKRAEVKAIPDIVIGS